MAFFKFILAIKHWQLFLLPLLFAMILAPESDFMSDLGRSRYLLVVLVCGCGMHFIWIVSIAQVLPQLFPDRLSPPTLLFRIAALITPFFFILTAADLYMEEGISFWSPMYFLYVYAGSLLYCQVIAAKSRSMVHSKSWNTFSAWGDSVLFLSFFSYPFMLWVIQPQLNEYLKQ